MRTFAIVNRKGGCGKTTTAVNLAAGFALEGQRTLLVDLDPQGHATLGLGYDPESSEETIYNALVGSDISFGKIITGTNINGLDIAPSSLSLSDAESELRGAAGREFLLTEQLRSVDDRYDICIIDCPPGVGLLVVNAIVASTDIIVPVQAHYYAMQGLKEVLQMVNAVRERYQPCSVKISGLLLTFVENKIVFSEKVQEQLREFFGDLVFRTVIHRDPSLLEAPGAGQSVLTYSPEGRSAAEYKALTKEISNGKA